MTTPCSGPAPQWLLAAWLAAAPTVLTRAQDGDGDGMSDALERRLATDPARPERLEAVAESPRRDPTPKQPARFDITRVRFGNVARQRWLWAVEFAAPYSFDNTLLLMYVDADNDPKTGRPRVGCEVTYGIREGRPTLLSYVAKDRAPEFPCARVGLENGVLYVCADLPLNQADGRSRFRLQLLSEQAHPHEPRDALRFQAIDGPGDSGRERILTLADITANQGFGVTQSAELLWRVHAEPNNVVFNAFRDCEADSFVYYHREYRWPAVCRTGGEGVLRVRVPKPGRFYPAAVVYDGQGAENYEMAVDGAVIGQFVARQDNRRQRLFFADKPMSFKGGELLTLQAANTPGPCVVEGLMLLAQRPRTLKPPCEIRNFEVGYDRSAGRLRATWITTWPAACLLTCSGVELREETAVQNHRLFLPELADGQSGTCRVQAKTPDGSELRSPAVTFSAARPPEPRGTASRERVALRLRAQERDVPPGWPLTSGVPFAQGVLGSADHIRLLDARGVEAPLQTRPLLQWPDGSVKVALLDVAAPDSGAAEPMTLEYGRDVRRAPVQGGVTISQAGAALTVSTPFVKMEFRHDRSGLFTRAWAGDVLATNDDAPARILITDDAGAVYDTLGPPDNLVVEAPGPLRAVVRLDGRHTGEKGAFFTYQVRFTFSARSPGVRISYRWGADVTDEFIRFRRIRFLVPLAVDESAAVLIGADEPARSTLGQGLRLEQLHHDRYAVPGGPTGKQAPGWVLAADGAKSAALLCRRFWQLYPKALGAADGALCLDLCPEFAEKQYNDCSEIDLIKLYYYLQDGHYKVRQGVTKIHEVWLLLSAGAATPDADELNRLAALINDPPVLAAPPAHYAASGVFGTFVPAGTGRTPWYDEVCDRVYRSYTTARNGARMYGMLNFGDYWGERKVNWSNGEYDHHHTMAQVFVRSADPRWFSLMLDAARHDIDVDLCHYHTDPRYRGGSWVHSMGHTGGYFTKQYQGQWGIPRGGMTPTHTWCEGTCEYYALTGDPTALEAARMIADHYGGAWLNNYDFTNGRYPGWHLLFTMAVYRATYDPFYLNAARIIVDRTLERRTPGSGWARQLVPGHCHCTPRCRGACSFMQGILGCGLREYFRETGDERVPPAVVDSARYIIEQMWVEEKEAFRYTSCRQSSVTASRSDTLAGLLLFAHEFSHDPRIADVAVRSMNLGFEHLSSVAHLRWTPYIVYALDRLQRDGLGVGGTEPTEFRLSNPAGRPFQAKVIDRSGRGAPPEVVKLTDPDGRTHRPDATGRTRVRKAQAGVYRLRLEPGPDPWLVTSSLGPTVLALGSGVVCHAGPTPGRLYVVPEQAGGAVNCAIHVLDGALSADLVDAKGKTLTTAQGGPGPLALTARSAQRDAGPLELRLRGPARLRLSATGIKPWAAFLPGRWFNASAPAVSIEGRTALLPGEGRTVRLVAKTEDPENDVATIRWELPGGRTARGAELRYASAEVDRFELRAVAVDAKGNEGSTTVRVSLPPSALADAAEVTAIQAEDFVAQGGGKVAIHDRIADVGTTVTKWHVNLGHWLEWEFETVEAGLYRVWARYASGGEKPLRRLTIDGELRAPEHEAIAFESTGGYCSSADNWALKKLGPPLRLAPGKHRLRLTNSGDGLALDFLAIAKAKEDDSQ